jgi:hypothetical protein
MMKSFCIFLLTYAFCITNCAQTVKNTVPEISSNQESSSEQPVKVTPCQLKTDPASYNHKLIEVTTFVSHGFENFTLFDPGCESRQGVWLEYGGTNASGTMYCCGVTSERSRPEKLVVEDIPISLVSDENFRLFDDVFRQSPDSTVRATIVGRFFAGKKIDYPKMTAWAGFGHMGCCTLLAIEKIVSIDPHNRKDVNYRSSANIPELSTFRSYRILSVYESSKDMIDAQQKAESGEQEWSFENPLRVATEALSKLSTVKMTSISGIKQLRQSQGSYVYEWTNKVTKAKYLLEISRPYWLTYYAKNPERVAWIVTAAYKNPY